MVSQVFVSILKSFSGSPVDQFPFTYNLFMFITPTFRIVSGTMMEQMDGNE